MAEALPLPAAGNGDAVGDGVVGIDADGRVAYLNPAAEAAFGYPRQTMIGQSLHALTHHSRADGST